MDLEAELRDNIIDSLREHLITALHIAAAPTTTSMVLAAFKTFGLTLGEPVTAAFEVIVTTVVFTSTGYGVNKLHKHLRPQDKHAVITYGLCRRSPRCTKEHKEKTL